MYYTITLQLRPPEFLLPFTVQWKENYIQSLVQEAEQIFDANAIGPKRYINLYNKYSRLLNGQEEKDKDAFLETKAPLKAFEAKMEGYANLNEEICEIRNSTMLNQYELDCRDFNNDMSQRCLNLRSSLINWQVDMNKTWNRQICNQFDEMATKLGEIPGIK